jgi:hypothetical protein
MTIQQNFQQRPKSYKEFTGTGLLVSDVPTTMCNNLRVVVENVGGGNTVVIRGKLFQQTAWQTLATVNGASTGTTVDISLVEEYQIECTAYAASGGTPRVVAAAFFNQAIGGGGGGISGAANVGSGGVGVFDAVSGANLNFRNINSASGKLTVVFDAPNKEIDLDVDESQIDVRSLDNVTPGSNNSFAGWSNTGELAQVPGYTFDDDGALRIGAQNSITVPAGLTDYYSISISPTLSNAITNVFGVWLNSPLTAAVSNYYAFTVNGYGTGAPLNYKAFESNSSYTGTGTDAAHFNANSSWDVTGTITGFKLFASGDAANLVGSEIVASGSYTSTTGIRVDLAAATSTGRKVGLEISEGSLSSSLTFSTSSNLPALVDSGNVIRPIFEVKSGSPITGTDVLMSNLAGFMDFKDNFSGSVLGLGVASVGFVSQVAVAAGKTASNVSMLTAGIAVDVSSAGGTITDLHLIRGFAANFGGSLNIGTIYGLQIESGISALATQAFGIAVEDTGAENYLAKSLKIDGGTKVVSDASIGLELGGTKTLRLAVVTTAQRTALPNVSGTMVYDSDTAKCHYNDGSGWQQF